MRPHWAIRGFLASVAAAAIGFAGFFFGCVMAWRSNGDDRWYYGLFAAGIVGGLCAAALILKWPSRRSSASSVTQPSGPRDEH